jgi:hypothetical protein
MFPNSVPSAIPLVSLLSFDPISFRGPPMTMTGDRRAALMNILDVALQITDENLEGLLLEEGSRGEVVR